MGRTEFYTVVPSACFQKRGSDDVEDSGLELSIFKVHLFD